MHYRVFIRTNSTVSEIAHFRSKQNIQLGDIIHLDDAIMKKYYKARSVKVTEVERTIHRVGIFYYDEVLLGVTNITDHINSKL